MSHTVPESSATLVARTSNGLKFVARPSDTFDAPVTVLHVRPLRSCFASLQKTRPDMLRPGAGLRVAIRYGLRLRPVIESDVVLCLGELPTARGWGKKFEAEGQHPRLELLESRSS